MTGTYAPDFESTKTLPALLQRLRNEQYSDEMNKEACAR